MQPFLTASTLFYGQKTLIMSFAYLQTARTESPLWRGAVKKLNLF